MSAISLKSITGITSITTPAGVDNQLTLHTNNTTERVKISSTGNVSITNDLDVDGHTNLDNVSIAGVTTMSGDLTISNTAPSIYLTDTNHNSDFRILNQNGTFKVYDQTNGADRLEIFSGGTVAIDGNLDANAGLDVTGNATFAGNIIGSQSQTFIGADTSDGSDNKSMMLGGGGASSVSRGAYVWVKGNEYSGAGGELILAGGGVSSSLIDFYTNSGQRARITSTGELNIGGSYTQTTNKLNVTGTAYVSSDITSGDDIIAADEIRNNVPSDFWASDNTFINLNSFGNITHQGGYEVNITSNGYRDTNGQWQSLAANSNTGAAQIGLQPQGNIIFRTDASKSNGTAHNPTERLRITSDGQVQINETTGTSADGASLKFYFDNNNSTDVISSIYFANNVGTVARITGETRNGNNYGMIRFSNQVNGVDGESMRLNHDGGFCVGTDSTRTAEFTTPDGFSVRSRDSSKGQFQVSVSGATCGLLNRKSSNGHILSFRKDGTGVGHIGVNASAMYLNFGGTNAAQHQLDDYETGTYTCTVYFATGNTTGNHTNTVNINGYFEKIGNLVFISLYFAPVTWNSGNTAIITKFSLPSTPVIRAAAAFYRYSGAANYGGMLSQSSQDDSGAYLDTNGFGYCIVGGTNQGSGFWGHHTGQINASAYLAGCYRIA